MRVNPSTDTVEPTLNKLRIDIDDPICKKSSTDIAEPILEKLRIDREEPR